MKGKILTDKNQRTLMELVMKSGNGMYSLPLLAVDRADDGARPDICADCKGRNPRWASHNIGIFIWYMTLLLMNENCG